MCMYEYSTHTHSYTCMHTRTRTQISYYVDEDNNWSIDVSKLPQLVHEAREHCQPRVMVVINPGNPTGEERGFVTGISMD